MTPKYVAKKSIAYSLNIWLILFFWLVIPLIIQIVKIIQASKYKIEFYEEKVVVKSGIFSTSEKQFVFLGVFGVSIEQNLLGKIFNYGDVRIDCPGKWDVDTEGLADPKGLKSFLEKCITTRGVNRGVYN